MEELICGIDLSGNFVRSCVGKVNSKNHTLTILGVGEDEHSAIRRGDIVNLEDLIEHLHSAFKKSLQSASISKIHSVITNVSGSPVSVDASSGVFRLGQSGRLVKDSDIENVINVAKAWPLAYDYEILHVIPQRYALDGQKDIRNPLNLFGLRLEVDTILISARSSMVKNIQNACHYMGLNLREMLYTGFAVSYALTDRSERKDRIVVMNIGWDITDFVIFESNLIRYAGSFQVGTHDLIKSIESESDMSYDEARRQISEIDLLSDNEDLGHPNPDKSVRLARAWTRNLQTHLKKAVDTIPDFPYLSSKIKISGDYVPMDNFLEYFEKELGTQVEKGHLLGVLSQMDTHIPTSYTIAVGLLKYIVELEQEKIDFKYRKKQGIGSLFDRFQYLWNEYF